MQSKDLMSYLEQVYKLERSLYEQNNIYWNIDDRIRFIANRPVQAINRLESKDSGSDTFEVIGGGAVIGGIAGAVIGLFIGGIIAGLFVGAIIGIIGSIILEAMSARDVEKRNQEIAETNRQITMQNEKNKSIANQKINLLKQQQNNIKSSWNNTRKILDDFYSCNVIFPKYRNFIAISSIYEYFSSGRCSQLEGHEGAYNIFENEIRQNIIISKLDDVINSLDSIRDSQYMLYSAIQESNKKANQLTGIMYQLSDRLSNISENTSICAYNSNITAQNTSFLKWLEFYRS